MNIQTQNYNIYQPLPPLNRQTTSPFQVLSFPSDNSSTTLDNILFLLAFVLFLSWWFQWFIHITAIIYGRIKLYRSLELPSDVPLPGVSILKPLTGLDPNLSNNLETFFNLDYPKYELIFCMEDEMDPARNLVETLISKYPLVQARVFCGGIKKVGVNPKINNMLNGYLNTHNPFVLISDSGLRMKPHALRQMVIMMLLDPRIGLVHQMPFVHDRHGFSALLEKVYFGTQHSKIYLLADLIGINCMTGMSCLFRKEVLDKEGGLKTLGSYLAEDYYLSQIIQSKGLSVQISPEPAIQNSGVCSVPSFHKRMIRWIKLRSSLVPLTIIMEPVSEWLILGILCSWSASILFSFQPFLFFLIHTVVWFLLDYLLLTTVQGGPVPFSIQLGLGWVFREMTSVILMLKAHSVRTLTWRSKSYHIYKGALGKEIEIPGSQLFV